MSADIAECIAPFTYTEIKATAQIRLLSILDDWDGENEKGEIGGDMDIGIDDDHDASNPKHRLCIQLDVYERGSEPAYEALSYTWGEPEKSDTITCNGNPLKVTRNFLKAMHALRLRQRRKLRKLRFRDSPGTDEVPPWIRRLKQSRSLIDPDHGVSHLWIDAVCIDQSNTAEKSGQVSIMGSIYQEAYCTAVYLGVMDDSARKVLAQTERLNGHSQYLDARSELVTQLRWKGLHNFKTDWKALYSRPWFTRTWVVQEALLSKQLTSACPSTVLIGPDEFYWASLALAGRVWHDADWAKKGEHDQMEALRVLSLEKEVFAVFGKDFNHERQGLSDTGGSPSHEDDSAKPQNLSISRDTTYECAGQRNMQFATLFVRNGLSGAALEAAEFYSLLQSAMGLRCQDPRDKLFGMRSLLDTTSTDLVVDYNKSLFEVFVDLSWYLISHGVFATLTLAGLCQRPAQFNYPSWVVDWAADPSARQKKFIELSPFGLPVPHWTEGSSHEFRTQRKGNALAIPGRIVDYAVVTGAGARWIPQGNLAVALVKTFKGARGDSGYCLITPEKGDRICRFEACDQRFVLRAHGEGWRLLGQCFYDDPVVEQPFVDEMNGPHDVICSGEEVAALPTKVREIWLI